VIANTLLLDRAQTVDVRVEGDSIAAIGAELGAVTGDVLVDARGGTLLPGLHDHHIHLLAFAAARESLQCGPPAVQKENELIALLREKNAREPSGWVRGIGYHSCVAGDIDRDWLDRHVPDHPARIQHRGGRMWVLNSRALSALDLSSGDVPPGLEQIEGRPTGRLYEADTWLRSRVPAQFPALGPASRLLASYGVTGVTDTTPTNGVEQWSYFRESQSRGALLQDVRVMGSAALLDCTETARLTRGEFKIHLLESRLPELETLCVDMESAHTAGRNVAIHCVTLTELVFALHALQTVGAATGDRIEHASVCPPEQARLMRKLGLRVVTQPHFVAERGDQYLAEVDPEDQPWLYRARGLLTAGIPLAGGSDAPFGDADPWRSMRAAVERASASGRSIGRQEALTPEAALNLYLSPAAAPGFEPRRVEVGARADLCLLNCPWERVRENLCSAHVRATWRGGKLIHCSV